MESDRSPQALLAEAERAAAAPYVDYPPSPTWFAPAAGLWAAALVLAVSGLGDRPALAVPLLVMLLAAEGAFFSWSRRRSQTMPSLRRPPAEIKPALRRYAIGVIGVVGLGVASYVLAGALVAAAVVFVSVTVGLVLYERDYNRAVVATRRRLGQ